MADTFSWAESMDVRVIVCDLNGIIVYMNATAALEMKKYGGRVLEGKSLFDCHNSISNEIISEMLSKPSVNIYIVDKDGHRKLIRQFPWIENGEQKGIIEISFPVPTEIPIKTKNS
jgi:hypothetical protein